MQALHQDTPVQQNESPHQSDQEDQEDNDDNSTDQDKGHQSESEKSADEEEDNKSDSEKEESDHENNDDNQSSRSSSSSSSKRSESSKEEEQEQEQDEQIAQDVVLDEIKDNLSYQEKVKKALAGDMDFHYPENVKIVRIFTSSTFTGKLRHHCHTLMCIPASLALSFHCLLRGGDGALTREDKE